MLSVGGSRVHSVLVTLLYLLVVVAAVASIPPPLRAGALPPRNTGEIVPPPSITEGTTRHLNVPAERTRDEN